MSEYNNMRAKEKQTENELRDVEKEAKKAKRVEIDDIDFDQAGKEIIESTQANTSKIVNNMQNSVSEIDDMNSKLKDQMKSLNQQKKNLMSSIEKLNKLSGSKKDQ